MGGSQLLSVDQKPLLAFRIDRDLVLKAGDREAQPAIPYREYLEWARSNACAELISGERPAVRAISRLNEPFRQDSKSARSLSSKHCEESYDAELGDFGRCRCNIERGPFREKIFKELSNVGAGYVRIVGRF